MSKLTTNFSFRFPLSHKKVHKVLGTLKLVTVYAGDLQIEGVAYEHHDYAGDHTEPRYTVDIDFIKWESTDIKPVLEVFDVPELHDIEQAALKHAQALFSTHQNREAI